MRLVYLSLRPANAWVFEPALLKAIKQEFPAWLTFEVDQASDEQNIAYALKLAEAPFVLLVEVSDKNESPAALGKLLNRLLQQKRKPVKAILYGEHAMLSRMLKRLAGDTFSSSENEKELIAALKEIG